MYTGPCTFKEESSISLDVLSNRLNAQNKEDRLAAVRALKTLMDEGTVKRLYRKGYINNRLNTFYSFSPYSPAKAVWLSAMSGLDAVGIMDQNTVAGADEFIRAGSICGITATVGFEIATDWSDTPFNGHRLNNPNQLSNAYIGAHGLPYKRIADAGIFLNSIRVERTARNYKMQEKLNVLLKPLDMDIRYDEDVLPLSQSKNGGAVTENHLLFALSHKLIRRYGKGKKLTAVLKRLDICLSEKEFLFLEDLLNPFYVYDLNSALYNSLINKIYIGTNAKEAIPVRLAIDCIKQLGAIPSYCYTGISTGDKSIHYKNGLEDLFAGYRNLGFEAVTYRPSQNTRTQLKYLAEICCKYGFMQICGEVTATPRQPFIYRIQKDPMFMYLADSAWPLGGYEKAAAAYIKNGMFSDRRQPNIQIPIQKIARYKQVGRP